MASFYGNTQLATEGWEVHMGTIDDPEGGPDHGKDYAYIAVPEYCECGERCCSRPRIGWRAHTTGTRWVVGDGEKEYETYADAEEAAGDWIEGVQDRLNDQEEDYIEENRHAIVQMERYEMWRNEY